MPRPRQTIVVVPIERLTAHPGNIRDDLGDLEEMARSIREHGILQPLTATEHPTDDGLLVLLAGHRRLRAALIAGETKVPVIIRHGVTDPSDQIVTMLVENTHRLDLAPVERAEAYGALRHRGLTNVEISRRTGTTQGMVSYYLNLLQLDDETRESVRNGDLSATSAITAVMETRQQLRKANGEALRGPKSGARKHTSWFGPQHRLAPVVRRLCTHHDRSKVGLAGCGPCWEQAIREDAGSAQEPEPVYDVDAVLVQRVLDGDRRLAKQANPAEKHAIAKRWAASGRPLAELARQTGWKDDRYGPGLIAELVS